MNVFILDTDPVIAAQMQCDKHVVKMVTETCQLLSSIKLIHGEEAPYKLSSPKHPSTLWGAASQENYEWLYRHFVALSEEYTRRYGKQHASALHIEALLKPPASIPSLGLTAFAQCMPDQYKVEGDAVTAYHSYYRGEKAAFAKWKMGNVPDWFVTKLVDLDWSDWE